MTTATVEKHALKKGPVRFSRFAATRQWLVKSRRLATLRNTHIAGVVVLGLVCLYLLVHIGLAWHEASSQDAAAIADQTVAMKTADIARKPLEGLDQKLVDANRDADRFYEKRLPFATSEVAGELGALAKKEGVKLTRVQYGYDPVLAGTPGQLTEAKMDASLSGDYRPLVLFLNALERDKMFFLISAVTLTGQQSGTVGLRLRLVTYLRAPVGAEADEKTFAPGTKTDDGASQAVPAGGAER